jgi:hypothetical protein
MIFSVRVDYESTMGEVGRVLRAVDEALGDQGIVWASSEDTIEGRSDSGIEPAAGYARRRRRRARPRCGARTRRPRRAGRRRSPLGWGRRRSGAQPDQHSHLVGPVSVAVTAELQLTTPAMAALDGEVLDPAALVVRAAEVAARQRSPETRRTYAAVYRSFAAFLGPSATAADVTPETVRAYRDGLERAGRAPTTVAKHLSTLRGLAEALGSDAAAHGALRARGTRRAARAHPSRVGAAATHARPPHAAGKARPRATAPARLGWPAPRRGGRGARRRRRRAPACEQPPAASGDHAFDELVGDPSAMASAGAPAPYRSTRTRSTPSPRG